MADDAAPCRLRLVNCRRQPVELHLGGSVLVLAAGQDVELDDADLQQPQLAYLIRNKALAVLAAAPPEAAAASGSTATTPRKRGPGTAAPTKRSPPPPKRKNVP